MTTNTNGWTLNPDGSWSKTYTSYPTYTWSTPQDTWVYNNPSMMQAIEQDLENRLTFPDAEAIINKLTHYGDKKDV